MPANPLDGADGVVGLTITANGARISDLYDVLAVRTRAETNRIPEAMIVLLDGDPATGDFPVTDSSDFKPGAIIEIKAGYGSGRQDVIFGGFVTAIRLRLRQNRNELEVTCRDKACRLQLGHKSEVYLKKKDSDILAAIVSAAGLTVDQTATTEEWPQLMRSRATDWDFILARAEASGHLVNIFDGKLTIKPPETSADAVLAVTYGVDLLSFDAEIDATAQYANFTAASWNASQQARTEATETAGTDAVPGNLTPAKLSEVANSATLAVGTAGSVPQSALTTLAKARKTRAGLAAVRGHVAFQGNALAKLGTRLQIKGMSARFNGTAAITGVVHRIEDGNWTTEAGIGLAPGWNLDRGPGIEPAAAAAALPPLRSLQIAVVAKLVEDPEGELRLQVNVPMLGGSAGDTMLWARFATPYAGSSIGLVLLPEIGDEVVLGFLDSDPSNPVILGALHSSKHPRPAEVESANNIKVFLSRAKLKLEFDEDKKRVTLLTPGGNTAVLDDDAKSITLKDQHGSKIVMDSSGILIDSVKDVQIKAAGKISVEATQDLALTGMNVSASAQVGLKAAGNASAELSAGGTTTISGALVKIN